MGRARGGGGGEGGERGGGARSWGRHLLNPEVRRSDVVLRDGQERGGTGRKRKGYVLQG